MDLREVIMFDIVHAKSVCMMKEKGNLYEVTNIEDYEIVCLLMRDVVFTIRKVYDFLNDVERERVNKFLGLFSHKNNILKEIDTQYSEAYSYDEDILLSVSYFYQCEKKFNARGVKTPDYTHTAFSALKVIVFCVLFEIDKGEFPVTEGLMYLSKYFDEYEKTLVSSLKVKKSTGIKLVCPTYEEMLIKFENTEALDRRLLGVIKKAKNAIVVDVDEDIYLWRECSYSFAILDEMFDDGAVLICKWILDGCYKKHFLAFKEVLVEKPEFYEKEIIFETDENKKKYEEHDELFGKIALCNSDRKLVTNYIYDSVLSSGRDEYTIVEKNGKYGWINNNNLKCISPQYDKIETEDETWLKVYCGSKFYFVDYENEPIAETFEEYDDVKLSWGYLLVKKEDKWGVVTKEKKICLPIVFDKIGRIDRRFWGRSEKKYMPLVGELWEKNEKYVFDNEFNIVMSVDLNTRILEYERDVSQGVVYQYVLKDGKVGYFNLQGKILVPALYEFCEVFNTFVCYGKENDLKIMFFKDYTVWDIGNQTAYEINGNAMVLYDENLFRIISKDILSECTYVPRGEIRDVSDVWIQDAGEEKIGAFVLNVDGNYGVIDLNGEIIIPFEYYYIFCELHTDKKTLKQYYEVAKKEDSKELYGLVDLKGNVFLECKYDRIYQNEKGDWILEKEDESCLLRD